MKANDGEAEEGNFVFGAKHAFIVHVDVEEFMESFHVANATMLAARADDSIEA
jgi:hypothetical protein